MRQTLVWCCLLLFTLGAVAETTAPVGFGLDPVLPAVLTPAGALDGRVRQIAMEADGRRVALQELALARGFSTPLAAGATYRRTRAHGRSVTNRYDAHGWELWGAWRARPAGTALAHPGLLLLASYQREDGGVQVITPTSASFVSPQIETLAGQGVLLWTRGAGSGHLRGGVARVALNGNAIATEWIGGGGWELPLGARFTATVAATAFRDDFQGHHADAELAGTLCYAACAHADLTLGGYYYPRGIPLAGAGFSPAAAVGGVYGTAATDALRNDAVGVVALRLDVRY